MALYVSPGRCSRLLDPSSYATSTSVCGCLAATRINVRAAPEGARRPCSHSCRVRTETPSNLANWDCERPVCSRTSATAGIFVTRPCSPRLISRIPSRISLPMFRLALLINLLPNLAQDVRRNVLGNVLGIYRQHPDLTLAGTCVIDDSDTAALAASRNSPPEFPHATCTANHITRLGIRYQGPLKR